MKYIRRVKEVYVPQNCMYCKGTQLPDYKNTQELAKYMSERGKILGKRATGLCAKHQRSIKRSIVHARYIALLPFVVYPR